MDLFLKFKQNSRVILLDPLSDEVLEYGDEQKFSIILSPSLYWVKKVSISVKYLRDFKKLLPSIFEEMLPEGNYSYSAYKEGDEYFAFAYEDRKIIELLKQKGLSLSNIVSIHFAQSELNEISRPALLNTQEAIYVEDGVVVIAPRSWFNELEPLELENIKPSNKTIQLQQFNHIVDNKSLYKIAFLMLFFIVILGVELFITNQKTAKIEEQRAEVFAKYHLKSTMMQNRAILQKYKKIDKIQRDLREYVSYFLKLRLLPGEKLSLVEYKNKKLKFLFEGVSSARIEMFLKKFKADKIPFKADKGEKSLHLEVSL